MLDLKKTFLALAALGSSNMFAGTMGPACTPGNVTVPCEHSGWDVGGQALDLQTTHSGSHFYITNANEYKDFSAQWNWGFQLEASYHFNTGNDLNVNWYHLDAKKQFNFDEYIAQTRHKWDAVNGELGQFVDFSANKKMRFHGGFQYARMKSAAVVDSPVSGDLATEFDGFGARAGIDMNYVCAYGFGIYAKAAGALLVGDAKFANAFGDLYFGKRTRVIPELEAKLGAKYTYTMVQGDLSLDAGYMWFNYFNALDNATNAIAVVQSDFAASGPYVGMKYVGNL